MRIYTEDELRERMPEKVEAADKFRDIRATPRVNGPNRMGGPENPFDDPEEIDRIVKTTICADN